MKEKLKHWLIPPGWIDLKNRLIKRNVPVKRGYLPENVTERLKDVKDVHKGERCFILASGPSINKHDLSVLQDETCIAVSQFFLHPQIESIKPKYHCFAPQHEPFDNTTNRIIFDNYRKFYSFPVKCFIGTTPFTYSYYNFLAKNPEYNVDSYFIDYSRAVDLNEHNFRSNEVWDITERPFLIRTVIYEAIQLAYYMGFKEIYLLGVDHDYLKDVGRVTNHHFYDDAKSFSDEKHLAQITKEDWFYIYHLRWKQYRLMYTYLHEQGVSIKNLTPDSMLDVFPFSTLEEVLKG